jgi:hypothetical protein
VDHQFSRLGIIVLTLSSGLLGALAGAVATALLTDSSVAIETTTVRGPVVTQFVEVQPGQGHPCSGTRVAGPPSYEPNDVAASAWGPLRNDQPITAALEESGDDDFFAFCLSAPARVTVRVAQTDCRLFGNDAYESVECEPEVVLLNDGGGTVAEATVGDSTLATIRENLTPGRYFVVLRLGNGFRYELRVSADPPRLTPNIPPS